MPEARHLIIAHAAPADATGAAALDAVNLPALQRLLARATPQQRHDGDAWSLTPPHEHALARALGWPLTDGQLPWAGWQAGRPGVACAWLWPCTWQAGIDQITIVPPQALDLRPEESAALRATFAPYAAEDGITLSGDDPLRWHAEGGLFDGWEGASLDRVAHRRADGWWRDAGASPTARTLLRLLSEAQMLFHDHPVNAARAARGALPVNGLWISGAGVWDGQGPAAAQASARLIDALSDPLLRGDAAGWRTAWERLDADVLAPWLAAAEAAGEPRWLTLCGERGWQSWHLDPGADPAPPVRLGWRDWWARLRGRAPTPARAPTVDWWSGL